MTDPLAAAIAFFALGANLLGAALLLLFNPGSRPVRWYTGFQLGIVSWLLAQGMAHLTGGWALWEPVLALSVAALPGLFVAASLAEDRERPGWQLWAAVALTALFVPVGAQPLLPGAPVWVDVVGLLWHVGGWTAGSLLQARKTGGRLRHIEGRSRQAVAATLLLLAPVSVAAGFLLGAQGFFTYVMPLVTVFVHLLVFYGITSMRFYDIEVRVARTGELAARAAETQRLVLLGELAATMAHEVRNPLTGVRSLAQRLAEGPVDEERHGRYAEVILEETGRVERMVRNLLELARRAPRPRWNGEPTPLPSLFDDLRLLTEARARERGVKLRTETRTASAPAPRDPLAQALLNLLLNAVDHTPEGGTVHLLARPREGGVELLVRDEGPGIPAEERERIFEPFRTRGPGTGLGLSVVRGMAREMGWEVSVTDAPKGGSEFRVRVPAKPDDGAGS